MSQTYFPAPLARKLNASVFKSAVAEDTSCSMHGKNGEVYRTREEESQIEVGKCSPREEELDSVINKLKLEVGACISAGDGGNQVIITWG